jgi:hypothetical protein
MTRFNVDASKYHLFIHKVSKSYVVVEKDNDHVFEKLVQIYDHGFECVSDSHSVKAIFLSFNNNNNTYTIRNLNFEEIKINQLALIPARTKLAIKIAKLLGL